MGGRHSTRRARPYYVSTYPPSRKEYVRPDSQQYDEVVDDGNTCEYSWVFSLGACLTSICTLLVMVGFFIWFGVRNTLTNE